MRELRVGARKRKDLEIKLRKMLQLDEQSQSTEEQPPVKSDTSVVIRRRKGETDKRISRMLKKL